MQQPTPSVERRLQEIGRKILDGAQKQKQSFWARERWEEDLLRKSMDNEHFRVQTLRFIDVLPVLKRDKALVAHLREYFGDEELPLPGVARWGIAHAGGALASHIMAPAVRMAMQKLGYAAYWDGNIR